MDAVKVIAHLVDIARALRKLARIGDGGDAH